MDRVVCGSLMTSLEMAGVSLTLLKMRPGWETHIGMLYVVAAATFQQKSPTQHTCTSSAL